MIYLVSTHSRPHKLLPPTSFWLWSTISTHNPIFFFCPLFHIRQTAAWITSCSFTPDNRLNSISPHPCGVSWLVCGDLGGSCGLDLWSSCLSVGSVQWLLWLVSLWLPHGDWPDNHTMECCAQLCGFVPLTCIVSVKGLECTGLLAQTSLWKRTWHDVVPCHSLSSSFVIDSLSLSHALWDSLFKVWVFRRNTRWGRKD